MEESGYDIPPPRKHYTKQRGEQRKPLLTGPELSAASAQVEEEMAVREEARSREGTLTSCGRTWTCG